ncbi:MULTISPECIES: hypothetical protein [Halomonadaceae]|jgi:hypothetical protein|nr:MULTISPECIES: hypothetical protein [Halomonas]MCG7576881.1 hypothetical protein [Halomonas sp. MMH1-48]MCG7591438.1 hypothetical protein [Halomonas sp. McD50-5]MCG7603944.1 hypothetical protein [Halomonas sp. MM17-34]MCG7613248.1 hypothetical protein [Halomonas sp. MM17-29]MCG7617550.1 hypothetical protein [Halomonas sp. McD50-4]
MSPTRALSSYALSTLLLANPALAATFNVSSTEPHGHWQSMALSLGDERHFRAVETHSYSDATLSVNTTQGVCDLPWLEMRVTLAQQQGESRAVNLVPTRLRIDDQPIIDTMAEFITERGDDGFYAHFYLQDMETLIEEMQSGEQLFLGFDQNEREPWYMTFSLAGADAAISRMQALCSAAAETARTP